MREPCVAARLREARLYKSVKVVIDSNRPLGHSSNALVSSCSRPYIFLCFCLIIAPKILANSFAS